MTNECRNQEQPDDRDNNHDLKDRHTYEELKTNARKFLTFTNLTLEEFAELLPAFKKAYLKVYPASKTKTGKRRKRKTGAGRKISLASIEQKLLFALVYQKSIRCSQCKVNCLEWGKVERMSGFIDCCQF